MEAEVPLLANENNDDSSAVAEQRSTAVDPSGPQATDEPQKLEPDVRVVKHTRGLCGCSPTVKICISHALSAWGDRMWMFAISVFLIALTPGSFFFTAIYGLSVSLSVVAFGTLVGDWIDITPRLKAARLTLIIQNVGVVACAVIVLVMFHWSISNTVFLTLAVVLVLLAIVVRLSSLGTTIAIERDWVVVIAQEDKFLLAGTNSILRRIDLTCNILAPVSTGLILDYGSTLIGVLFIAGWNIASVFVEYTMLSSVYRSCPALANKAVDVNRLEGNVVENAINHVPLDYDDVSQDGTVLVPRVKTPRSFGYNCRLFVDKIWSRVRVLRYGLKLFFRQRVAFAGIGLSCLYMTVLGFDSITTAYAYSQHVSAGILGVLTAAGALTGILGTFMFPKLREVYGLVKTGLISNSTQLFFLMLCVVSVWAPGHPGHMLDPNYHGDPNAHNKTESTEPKSILTVMPTRSLITTTFSSNVQQQNTLPFSLPSKMNARPSPSPAAFQKPNISAFLKSTISPKIIPSHIFPSNTRAIPPSVNVAMNTTRSERNTTGNSSSSNNEDHRSFISMGLLMGGIVMSRIGLWMTDLVITQLFQENVPEQERGIVSGVQNSFNSIMDVIHFVMVTVAPRPEQFGILILISVAMVAIGFAFYSRFAWNHRRSIEDTSRRLSVSGDSSES